MATPLSRRLRTGLFYALRTAFRLTPMPQGTRDRLRERFLDTKGHWVPEGPKGKPPTGELPRRPYVRSDERAIGYVPYEKGELPDPLPATLVAFYLPQFHTIPENDEWWGKGFTEWRNVTRALPQFEGHYQPKLPGDLGFYDLRNVEVMHEQARLAREYGISAFCFYFYWFGGKTLLETPLRNWLNDKTIDLKFCLCWANEKWTRTWDGRGDEILIDQKHSPEDDIAFIEHVAEYMRDPRYLRVDGKPMLVVYRPGLFPDMKATAARWRAWCMDNGIGAVELAYVQSFDASDPSTFGFDAAIEFPPLGQSHAADVAQAQLINEHFAGRILDFREMASAFERTASSSGSRVYPGVNPGWDNEARRPGKGLSFLHATPLRYERWLRRSIAKSDQTPQKLGHVFINAWNEWAEGATLEPDLMHGHAYLRATRRALGGIGPFVDPSRSTRIVLHVWYLDALNDIVEELVDWEDRPPLLITCPLDLAGRVAIHMQKAALPHELVVVPNRGRDILPFLQLASRLAQEGVAVVLKLHTKKSPHLTNGAAWRKELVQTLVRAGSAAMAEFERDPTLGLIAPAAHFLHLDTYMGSNAAKVSALASQLGLLDAVTDKTFFASGSMFWVRLDAIRPLLESSLRPSDFETEAGQLDGTLAHAVERLFAACVDASGYRIAPAGAAELANRIRYPYARAD